MLAPSARSAEASPGRAQKALRTPQHMDGAPGLLPTQRKKLLDSKPSTTGVESPVQSSGLQRGRWHLEAAAISHEEANFKMRSPVCVGRRLHAR